MQQRVAAVPYLSRLDDSSREEYGRDMVVDWHDPSDPSSSLLPVDSRYFSLPLSLFAVVPYVVVEHLLIQVVFDESAVLHSSLLCEASELLLRHFLVHVSFIDELQLMRATELTGARRSDLLQRRQTEGALARILTSLTIRRHGEWSTTRRDGWRAKSEVAVVVLCLQAERE